MSTYLVSFPCGIEDAVRYELTRFVTAFCALHRHVVVDILSRPVEKKRLNTEKHSLQRVRKDKGPRQPRAQRTNVPEPLAGDMYSPRGALYFTVSPASAGNAADTQVSTDEEFEFVYRLSFSLRTIDQVFLSLGPFRMEQSIADITDHVEAQKECISHAVVHKLSAYRVWLGGRVADPSYPQRLPAFLFGERFLSPVTHSSVLFRVNAVRLDKSFHVTSQDICRDVGDQLMAHFEAKGWAVDMIYHHVEFFVLHDHQRNAHLGLLVSAPPLPRDGMDLNPARQLFSEYLRQRIGRALVSHAVPSQDAFRGLIARVATCRHEMRMAKGENAMLSQLAAALVCYADMEDDAASGGGRGDALTLVDPFGGSASLLVEAWLGRRGRPLMGLCGELNEQDYHRASLNTSPAVLTCLALLNGQLPVPEPSGSTFNVLAHWKEELVDLAERVPLSDNRAAMASTIGAFMTRHAHFELQKRRLVGILGQPHASAVFTPHLSVAHADATRMALRTASIDRVVTDLPFGRRCGTHKANTHLYPRFLRECHRVLVGSAAATAEKNEEDEGEDGQSDSSCWWRRKHRDGRCGRAVLLTLDATAMMWALASVKTECPFKVCTTPFQVDMAGLLPYVFVLEKHASALSPHPRGSHA